MNAYLKHPLPFVELVARVETGGEPCLCAQAAMVPAASNAAILMCINNSRGEAAGAVHGDWGPIRLQSFVATCLKGSAARIRDVAVKRPCSAKKIDRNQLFLQLSDGHKTL
jgi:hypothetical protein